MDDLKHQVDELGRRMDAGFRDVSQRMDGVQQSIVGMHRSMSQFAMMLVVALVGMAATQLGLILTQL